MYDIEKGLPNPGSRAAVILGCTCPILDNHHGVGYHGIRGKHCINAVCPLHGDKCEDPKNFTKKLLFIQRKSDGKWLKGRSYYTGFGEFCEARPFVRKGDATSAVNRLPKNKSEYTVRESVVHLC